MPERRTTTRNLCSDIVELTWKDRLNRVQRFKGVLEDISMIGACVQSEQSLPLDVEVTLRLRESRFEATVCYSTLIDGGYFVGVRFEEGHGWTPGFSDPEYLLQIPTAAYEAIGVNSEC